ncbi:MAG: amino acid permease [Xanthomonadaceae bacterium]|nr:amino acid permease [Xanthomonadaceae bacterium]
MANSSGLIRGLGLVGLIASTFNCTVGGGIFKLPAAVYAIAGPAAPFVYLTCFIVMFLIVAVFVQVGSRVKTSGGPYAYVQPVLGSYVGFLCGVLLWFLATFAMASVANAYAGFLGMAVPLFSGAMGNAVGVFITLAALSWININGVKAGSKTSIFLSIAKLFPLLLLVFAGIPHIKSEALLPPVSSIHFSDIARGAMVLIFAFTGVESALIPSGEIANPKKNLPRALYAALFLVLFLYLGVQSVTQSVLGEELRGPMSSPLMTAAERIMGTTGGKILGFGALLSTLGYLSAITMSLPRTLLAFAEDGYLPKVFGKIDPKTHTPVFAIIVQSFIGWALAVSSQFEKLAVLANLSAILMYILCVAAAIKLKNSIVPWLSFIAMGFLLTSVTTIEWMSVGGLLALSSIGYYFKHKKN